MSSDDKVYNGTVIFFDIKQGYGFLQWEIDGTPQKDIFAHYSDINCEGFKAIYKDQKVSFKLGVNKRGETKAIEITIVK